MEEYPTPAVLVVMSAPFAMVASAWGQVFYLLIWGLAGVPAVRAMRR
jgi:hypothetical protein